MKILKSRLFIGGICILMAVICIFAGIKAQEKSNEVTDLVMVSAPIKKGELITDEMLTTKTMGAKNTEDFITDKKEIVGKFALTDLVEGDFFLESKIADELPSVVGKLMSLDGSRVAISVSIKDFASGVSDKILSGDIVSCIVTRENGTTTPPELTYVEVLATTTPSGVDKEYADEVEEENLATVTLLVTPRQAELLAEFDKTAEIHLALVYRGDKITTEKFLSIQSDTLTQDVEEEIEQIPEPIVEVTPEEVVVPENENVTDSEVAVDE